MKHREYTTGEVQKYIANAPADGRFPLVIVKGLWHVFDEGNRKFHVAAVVQEIEPKDHMIHREYSKGQYNADEHSMDYTCRCGYPLITSLWKHQNHMLENIYTYIFKQLLKPILSKSRKVFAILNATLTRPAAVVKSRKI